MNVQEKPSPVISSAQEHNLIPRLPRTFQPYINQEIQHWQFKFPYEKTYLERVVGYLDGLAPDQFESLFSGVRQIEAKMKLNSHSFSAQEQTIEGASVLARSPYYIAWRGEVNKVFEQIHASAWAEEQARLAAIHRLLLLIFPKELPLDPATLIGNWPEAELKKLDWDAQTGARQPLLEAILKGQPQADGICGAGFLEEFAARTERVLGDVWLIESGTALKELLPGLEINADGAAATILLSFERLQAFREGFLDQIKSMRKALADADKIMDRLRGLDVTPWCPPEIHDSPIVQEFVRSLFLSNNGSQLFSNAFLEWGATQAVAHARPVVVLGEFGMRTKPKPFTSVAIFEDPSTANPLPSLPDPEGSAEDAGMLAYYTWLEMRRYPECRRTACVCLFENTPQVLIAGAEDFWEETGPVSPARLAAILRSWIS